MGWYHYCILALLLLPTAGHAYPTPVDVDGTLHRWEISADAPNIYFAVEATDALQLPFFMTVVQTSVDLWNDIDGAMIKIHSSEASTSPQITVHYQNSIAGGNMAAGYTVFDDVSQNKPNHCSIYIAADQNSDYENLHKTTLHELGHCLGLQHSLMAESIMSYYLDKNSFALSIDDQAAIARLYPINGSGAKLAPGCAIGGRGQRSDYFVGSYLLLILPILWGAMQRVRR